MYKLPLLLIINFAMIRFLSAQECEGTNYLNTQFESGIPSTWTILDLDTHKVYWSLADRGYTGKFQPFTRNGRKCVANVAYFSPSGTGANDWLISPQVTLGSTPLCLSWKSASMYSWSNTYEVRISTTTPTVAAFMSNPPLYTQVSEQVDWTSYNVNLSSYAGKSVYIAIYYNAVDQYPIYFDDIRITAPVTRDLSVKKSNLNYSLRSGSYPITGVLYNGGTSAVNSFTLNWKVNNGNVHSATLSALNIQPGTYYNYAHSTNWQPYIQDVYYLKIWATNINGASDINPANDTCTEIHYIHNNPRKVLVEEFTNTDCPPCAAQNPAFDLLLASNRDSGKVTMIKYHASWPGPTDPFYVYNKKDALDRLYYYGSPGLPNGYVEGKLIKNDCSYYLGAPSCLDQTDIDSALLYPGIFDIQIANNISGSQMNIIVNVTALTNVPETNLKLRTVVIEDSIYMPFAPGTNGELDFFQVMRKMLPDNNGLLLPAMSKNQNLSFPFTYTFSGTVIDKQLRTVAFIQNDLNYNVYQSQITNSVVLGLDDEINNELYFTIFPNPTDAFLNIKLNNYNSGKYIIELYNNIGSVVYTAVCDKQYFYADISKYARGIYVIKVSNDKRIYSRKIILK